MTPEDLKRIRGEVDRNEKYRTRGMAQIETLKLLQGDDRITAREQKLIEALIGAYEVMNSYHEELRDVLDHFGVTPE